ncbi:helix-turn-helix DNA binding protein [Arthrobacter phage Beagle]|nr:helix-turn-helix DNA binding protein [Arthrobacter phage Beagle]
MSRIPEEHMAEVHIIRQDYARALNGAEAFPLNHLAQVALEEVRARRERAIRMIHEEDGMSVRHLAAMFRCNKQVIRAALEGGES